VVVSLARAGSAFVGFLGEIFGGQLPEIGLLEPGPEIAIARGINLGAALDALLT
jgi:hypothetical protein